MALADADTPAVPDTLGDSDLACVSVSIDVELELGDNEIVRLCDVLDEEG